MQQAGREPWNSPGGFCFIGFVFLFFSLPFGVHLFWEGGLWSLIFWFIFRFLLLLFTVFSTMASECFFFGYLFFLIFFIFCLAIFRHWAASCASAVCYCL